MSDHVPLTVELVSGQLADRFTILEVLRSGGQGVVYRAVRVRLLDGTPTTDDIALKLYLDPRQNERVAREIRALEGFSHPNLANLMEHGAIEYAGQSIRYIAWEFIAGQALDLRLRGGAVSPGTVACIGRDISRAISHVWTKRIVHRDVNPKNIILRASEREAVLIDLGVARHLSESTLTSPGLTWGTNGYLSPEQCRTEANLTCQSDVFSLGVVLQEALCGHHPTLGNQFQLIHAVKRTAELAPSAPVALVDLVDSMLRPRAAFRPSPEALVAAFANVAASA